MGCWGACGFPPVPWSFWVYVWSTGSGGGAGFFLRWRLGRPWGLGWGAAPWGAHASPFLLSALWPLPSSLPVACPPSLPLAVGRGPPAAWGSAAGAWLPSGGRGGGHHQLTSLVWAPGPGWGGTRSHHRAGGSGGGGRLVLVPPPLVGRGLGCARGTRWLGALGGSGLPVGGGVLWAVCLGLVFGG